MLRDSEKAEGWEKPADRQAPKETYEQFERGEISREDFEWLTGEKPNMPAMFLVSSKHRKAAHYWTGTDTACRMYSTGGLGRGYGVTPDRGGRRICAMCSAKLD